MFHSHVATAVIVCHCAEAFMKFRLMGNTVECCQVEIYEVLRGGNLVLWWFQNYWKHVEAQNDNDEDSLHLHFLFKSMKQFINKNGYCLMLHLKLFVIIAFMRVDSAWNQKFLSFTQLYNFTEEIFPINATHAPSFYLFFVSPAWQTVTESSTMTLSFTESVKWTWVYSPCEC